MTQSRTHTCGELRLANAGETVTLVGWMENIREVGNNFAFLVLRDFYGTTQVVIENEEMMNIVKPLNKESTISVTGIVRERTSKNPKLPTGDIEIAPTEITVLGRCRYNELPFEINHSREADESQRLKYRYLDLRNPEVKANIILRCNVVSALRTAMTEHGFLEITTPILTASSPEGARDYLVPARKHPGKFYALPQAPQQFKQLLMTAGFDRYFQIAPCFRDEDARGDRSPGEFYQMDMEMAFASQEDVFAVIEDVLPPIFAKYGTYNIASSAPFARIPYRQAMEEFGSDKPDLRIDLRVKDVTDILQNCGFGPFENNTVKAVPVSNCKLARKAVDKLCADVEVQAGQKPYWFKVDESGAIAGGTVDSYTTLRKGATGTAVVTLQTRLIELGYLTGDADGKYGIATAEAVTLFQKNNGLLRDGIAGKDTQTKLYSATAVKAESATPTPAPTSSLIMKGDSNESVRELQARLIALGYLSGSADGKFGVQTFEALKAFQRKNGLKVDGIAGTNTLTLLNSSNAISNGTTSLATATPTTSTGGSTGTVTKPTASMVQYANWYTTVKALARKYPYATVYDFSTGLSWQVHMFSLGAHADAEPLTAQDTANLEKAFGGNTWNPKAVWVIFADGSVYMASTHSMPHSPQHRTDNNFDGHLCIHFPRTMAQVTAIGPYATSHQKCIDQGWQTTQSMIK